MSDRIASPAFLRLYQPPSTGRAGWHEIKGHIGLAKVAGALLGPPIAGAVECQGWLFWCCPFHEDSGPSFRVRADGATWSCIECDAAGDAAALVMRIKGMSFREATMWLDEHEDFIVSRIASNRAPSVPSLSQRRPFLTMYAPAESAASMETNVGITREVVDPASGPR